MSQGLVVTDLRAAHGSVEILHGIDLAVSEGTLACILGPSGCGKTTLLRTIAGFHRPNAGRVELHERVLDDPPGRHIAAERRRVGYIPQDVALFPHLSVAANIGFGLPRNARTQRTSELLELIGLGDYADRRPHQLSGGQQQRVALARALAPEPDLLLLDEPFSALDASLRARVRADVAGLLRETGTTAILVTHDSAEALGFADRIAVMSEGFVLQTGTPENLHNRPITAAVAHALGEANIVQATITGNLARTVLGMLPVSGADPTTSRTCSVVVRPEQIMATENGVGISAQVRSVSFQGSDYRIESTVDGCPAPVISRSDRSLTLGSTVHLLVRGSIHLLAETVEVPL